MRRSVKSCPTVEQYSRQYIASKDGCFGSGRGGFDVKPGQPGARSVRYVECDMCISGKECRALADHRFKMRRGEP